MRLAIGLELTCGTLLGVCSLCLTLPTQVEYTLGISLQPNWQEPITFATLGIHKNKIVSTDFHSAHEFTMIASGNMRSKANPSKVNYFEAYHIPHCEVEYDAPMREFVVRCSVVEQLWRLRYAIKPGTTRKQATVENGTCSNCGWARFESGPDSAQVALLKQFGVEHLSGWIIGEQAFQLIQATTDPSFISAYQSR